MYFTSSEPLQCAVRDESVMKGLMHNLAKKGLEGSSPEQARPSTAGGSGLSGQSLSCDHFTSCSPVAPFASTAIQSWRKTKPGAPSAATLHQCRSSTPYAGSAWYTVSTVSSLPSKVRALDCSPSHCYVLLLNVGATCISSMGPARLASSMRLPMCVVPAYAP